MKKFKYILSALLLFTVIWSCTEDEFGDTDFIETAVAPTNVEAVFSVTQDNTGTVTIAPNSVGAVSYDINFGDGSDVVTVAQGKSVKHVYAEGDYDVTITAYGITGLKTVATEALQVAFIAPQNLMVEIANDEATSKQVNVTAEADYAITYDVYFGEEGKDDPVSGNIGETVSYIYQEPGTYTIRVVAKGAAIETTEYEVEFEVTEIVQPIMAAPTPTKNSDNVISIYSDAYINVPVSEWNPGWGQSTVLSTFEVDGNPMLKYDFLNYTGIVTDYGNPTDLSAMEYVHFDYWTNDAEFIGFKIVNTSQPDGSPEKEFEYQITDVGYGKWVSVDIPLSEFTTDMSGVTQMLFVSNGVTVFIDNLYYWKEPTVTGSTGPLPLKFEEEYTLFSFDGGAAEVVENPDKTGNTSDKVLQMVKGAGQPWAGTKVTVNEPFDISEGTTVTMKVWSPRSGLDLLIKFEDATPWPDTNATAELTQTTTTSGWQQLTYTVTGVDPNLDYNNLVLIMDNGTQGDGSADYTIYVDDINTTPALDFEDKYSLSSFDGGAAEVVDNPDTSGNTSAKVLQLVKNAGQPWAGSKITVNEPFTITEGSTITMKVWAPRADLNLLIKFEDTTPWPDTKATAELTQTTTVANGWQELTYTVTGVDPNVDYYNLVLIMDNGTQGDGSADYTIYVDDISQN